MNDKRHGTKFVMPKATMVKPIWHNQKDCQVSILTVWSNLSKATNAWSYLALRIIALQWISKIGWSLGVSFPHEKPVVHITMIVISLAWRPNQLIRNRGHVDRYFTFILIVANLLKGKPTGNLHLALN